MKEGELKKLFSRLVAGLAVLVAGIGVLWIVLLVKIGSMDALLNSWPVASFPLPAEAPAPAALNDGTVADALVMELAPLQRIVNEKAVTLPGQYVLKTRATVKIFNAETGQSGVASNELAFRITPATTVVRLPATADGQAEVVDIRNIKTGERLIVATNEGIFETAIGGDYPTAAYIEILPAGGDPRDD